MVTKDVGGAGVRRSGSALGAVCRALTPILLMAVCLGAATAEPASPVRIAGAAYFGDLPTHVADARGLFAAEGLEASVTYSESGKDNLARLRAGKSDFALMALTPLVLDRLADADPGRPDDPVILASLLQSYELTAVVAGPRTGIERPADLRGHRIAFERGTNTEFVWWLFAQFHGIDRTSVETISMRFSEAPEAVASGRVAAAVLPEPWVSRLQARFERSGTGTPRRFDTRHLYAGRWVVVTTRGHVARHRNACRRVLAAYRRAVEFIERSPTQAISLHAESVGTNADGLFERWETLDYDLNLDWALIASLQAQARWARDRRTSNSAPFDVLDLIASGPLRATVPEAVHISVDAGLDRSP